MKIIPVMDLLNGLVVQGIGGRRNEYQPISNSVISSSAQLLDVAKSYQSKLGLNWFYIADLDRIQVTKNMNINRDKIIDLAKSEQFEIAIDAGCKTVENVIEIADWNVNQIVIGTETLQSLDILSEAADQIGSEKIMLSIDIKSGDLVANSPEIKKLQPNDIAYFADELCLKGLIVIELHKVGSQSGPLNQALLDIVEHTANIPVFAGGGVRNVDDLIDLQNNNISGALVATAFHNGSIGKEDLDKIS